MWSVERNIVSDTTSTATPRLPDADADDQGPQVIVRDFAYSRMAVARNNIRDASATTFADLLSGPLVDIYVGKEKRQWSLHRNLLCHYSSYFEAEFVGNEVPKAKRPGDKQRLDLPDDDPKGFELFVKWLYQGQVDDVSEMPEENKYDYSVSCYKLFMLCDRFHLPLLKNISIDQYRRGLSEAQLVPDEEEINEIYRRSPAGSPFRKLMTQIAARQIMDPASDKDAETYRACFENNPDFAVDMVNAIKTGTGGVLFNDPTEGAECEYHDHKNGKTCEEKAKRRGPSSNISSQRQPNAPPKLSTQRRGTVTASQGSADHTNGVVGHRHSRSNGSVTWSESLNGHASPDKQPGTSRGVPIRGPPSTLAARTYINGNNGANGVNGYHHADGRPGSSGSDKEDKEEADLTPTKRRPPKLRRRSPPPNGVRSPQQS